MAYQPCRSAVLEQYKIYHIALDEFGWVLILIQVVKEGMSVDELG